MSQKSSSPPELQLDRYKQIFLDKFTSAVKLLLGEDIARMILSFTIVLLFLLLYYFQDILNFGMPRIEKDKVLFFVIFSPILLMPIFSRARHTRSIYRELRTINREKIHLEPIYNYIFQIYKRLRYFPKPIEKRIKQSKDQKLLVRTVQKRAKQQLPTSVVLNFVFALLFIITLTDPILKIYAGSMGLISSVFEFFHYRSSKKWLKIYEELNHWGEIVNKTDTPGDVPGSATIALLEEDFYVYESENKWGWEAEEEGEGKGGE